MMEETGGLEPQPSSRMCFLCGVDNPVGLRLSVYSDVGRREVRSTLSVPAHFQGYPGVVHGGIVATLLDEVAGRAVLIEDPGRLMVTLKLEVRYRLPTPIATPLTVVGRVTHPGRARARARGEVQLADGTVTAEADLLLVEPPAGIREAWAAERPFWRVR